VPLNNIYDYKFKFKGLENYETCIARLALQLKMNQKLYGCDIWYL